MIARAGHSGVHGTEAHETRTSRRTLNGALLDAGPRQDRTASLLADFDPDFNSLLLVVVTIVMVIDIDPLLDPELEPGITLIDSLPELEFGPILIDSLLDSDLGTGIIVVIPVVRRLRPDRTRGERKSRNCSNANGARKFRHFDHFLNESFQRAGWSSGTETNMQTNKLAVVSPHTICPMAILGKGGGSDAEDCEKALQRVMPAAARMGDACGCRHLRIRFGGNRSITTVLILDRQWKSAD